MKKIEQTLTSMEVAEMIGRGHKELLRSIRLYAKNMEKVAERTNAPGKENAEGESSPGSKEEYFKESTYEDANGQSRPCFNVTKKGCEFIAHKMNGIKGTEFTMRYIDRFHKMEEVIDTPKPPKNTMELLELHYQALKEVDSKVDKAEQKIDALDKKLHNELMNLPLLGVESDTVDKALKSRGVEIAGGKESNAYKDKNLLRRIYWDLHGQLRREFGVSTYKAIKRNQTDLALKFLAEYKPPLLLAEQIESVNAQQIPDSEGGAQV